MTSGNGWFADGTGGHTRLCEECGDAFGPPLNRGETASAARRDVTRCPACRSRRLAARNERMLAAYAAGPIGPAPGTGQAPGTDGPSGPLHEATCAACRRPIRVPFRPRDDRPVYCRGCRDARDGR